MNANELVSDIKNAFKKVSYPGDDPKNVGNCWELSRILGKQRTDVSVDDINTNWGLHHFTPRGLRRYLPAYLIAFLQHPDEIDGLCRESLLKTLSLASNGSVQREKFVSLLNSSQVNVIRRFLEAYEDLYPIWIKEWDFAETLKSGNNYWQSLDQFSTRSRSVSTLSSLTRPSRLPVQRFS